MKKQEQHYPKLSSKKVSLKKLQADIKPEYPHRIEIILRTVGDCANAEIYAVQNSVQDVHYWTPVQSDLTHDWSDRAIGRPKIVNAQYLERLKELVSHSPKDYGYSFRQWTAQWLRKHLARELGIEVSDRHINRLLKQMGLSTRKKSTESKVSTVHQKTSCITIGDLQPSSQSEACASFNVIALKN